ERLNGSLKLSLVSLPEVRIQFTEVAYSRHRCGETSLYRSNSRLRIRFFITSSRHARERLEDVVTGQGPVARGNLALTPLQDQSGDCLGIVPPDFFRDGIEELEGSDHAFEDCLGTLGRQS